MVKLTLKFDLADRYTSPSQRARVLTEHWLGEQGYCPNCRCPQLRRFTNNNPGADFECPDCGEQYELKSGRRRIGFKVIDGAYSTMLQRIQRDQAPNLILARYDLRRISVTELFIVPRHFITESSIEIRKPLSQNARRAGWVGCNILLTSIPAAGRICIVNAGMAIDREEVFSTWQSGLFLRHQAATVARGWLVDVMACLDSLGRTDFSLTDVYGFEAHLKSLHPANANIRAKIRQQLQRLRDGGYIRFMGHGYYRRTII
ncbi:DpnI domain-containing protein [Roseomonas sp. AR75]|uniref:DpnI domain-containing protein n=1 Tax=Roseomonas sp. AR75 TaxID=2562311 RepID=UPI0010C12832|nr:DpnI domain-containing protein [Roseomonas sp. AR75]